MSDTADFEWLLLAAAVGWFADHIGRKKGMQVLLRALADGRVLARGVRPPESGLVAIPKGVWSCGQINWRASTVVDLPDAYQSVQVNRLQLVRLLGQPGETARGAGQCDKATDRSPDNESRLPTQTAHVGLGGGRRLSIERIARLWASDSGNRGLLVEDIAAELVDAAVRGEFEITPEGSWHRQDGKPPDNYDVRSGRLIEVFTDEGKPIGANQLNQFLETHGARTSRHQAKKMIARDAFLSLEGLRRWCNRPQFADWADLLGLSRPGFLERQSDTSTGVPTQPDPHRTGFPGRPPKAKHLIEQEFRRRVDAGEVCPTLPEEAGALLEWLKGEHPSAPPPTVKTIKNNIRGLYRRYGQKQHPTARN